MDEILAKGCGISAADLMPWHYQNRYFQEAPKIYNIDLDTYYKNVDIVKTVETFYKGIGMPMETDTATPHMPWHVSLPPDMWQSTMTAMTRVPRPIPELPMTAMG